MGVITDLVPQKKDPKRLSVFIDGEFSFGISRQQKILYKLQINQKINQEKINKLIFTDQIERLFEKAFKYLSYRPRSEKEIRDKFRQKLKFTDKSEAEIKQSENSVEEVIKRLKKIGQVDDREFAKWWVEQRLNFKKTSFRVIKNELFQKGIDKGIIEEETSKVGVDDFLVALKLAEKKLNNYKKREINDFKIKMTRFLASKGFGWETIKRVVDTLDKKR